MAEGRPDACLPLEGTLSPVRRLRTVTTQSVTGLSSTNAPLSVRGSIHATRLGTPLGFGSHLASTSAFRPSATSATRNGLWISSCHAFQLSAETLIGGVSTLCFAEVVLDGALRRVRRCGRRVLHARPASPPESHSTHRQSLIRSRSDRPWTNGSQTGLPPQRLSRRRHQRPRQTIEGCSATPLTSNDRKTSPSIARLAAFRDLSYVRPRLDRILAEAVRETPLNDNEIVLSRWRLGEAFLRAGSR